MIFDALGVGLPVPSDKGSVIYTTGVPADRIYFLTAGSVVSERFNNAKKANNLVQVYGPGECFGETALKLTNATWPETARVLSQKCEIRSWWREDALRVMANDSAFAGRVRDMLIAKIEQRDRWLAVARFNLIPQRLGAVLADLADRIGETGAKKGEILLSDITHQCLGEMVGATRSLVTSSMLIFRKEKYIEYSGQSRITILRLADLRNLHAQARPRKRQHK